MGKEAAWSPLFYFRRIPRGFNARCNGGITVNLVISVHQARESDDSQ
jgi:hypothetical protein